MVLFEANDEKPKIELKRHDGRTQVLTVEFIGDSEFKLLADIDKERSGIENDFPALMDLAYRQLAILSPETKRETLTGMPVMRLFELIQKMTELAIGMRDGEEKKIPGIARKKLSGSSKH